MIVRRPMDNSLIHGLTHSTSVIPCDVLSFCVVVYSRFKLYNIHCVDGFYIFFLRFRHFIIAWGLRLGLFNFHNSISLVFSAHRPCFVHMELISKIGGWNAIFYSCARDHCYHPFQHISFFMGDLIRRSQIKSWHEFPSKV